MPIMRAFSLFLTTLTVSSIVNAQKVVTRNDTVQVFHGTKMLKHPWASGLNAAHISEFDFNDDGKMDLFVFEPNNGYNEGVRNKILPFINKGIPNVSEYEFAPEYRNSFPFLDSYAVLRDYNCDGKPDIFTVNGFQGMRVYRNDGGQPVTFTKVKETLLTDTSDLPPFFVSSNEIYWNLEDYPSFTDIDNDGDMDILTVDRYGAFIEYQKNMSKEKYGICDSLDFKVRNTCWGRIFEDNLLILLDTCHPYGNVPNPENVKKNPGPPASQKRLKHSNTSLLAIDLNGDGVKDILSGDGATNGLYSFINGGTKDSSKIISFTTSYPPSDPVNIPAYAIPSYVETNNDNKKDLIVSVRYDNLKDRNSVWKYKNTGSNSHPNFILETKEFLQEEMIDVGTRSHPVFFDYDGDSLLDLIIGASGYFKSFGILASEYYSPLAYYRNTGDLQAPKFELVTLDLDSISKLSLDSANNKPAVGLHPTFGDLDGDGDQDMLLGDRNGKIHFFRNNPIGTQANFTLAAREFQSIDVGDEAAPFLFDIDGDSILDLFIGELFGKIHYYANSSATNPSFTLVDADFGDIDVITYFENGYSVPYFFRDSLGDLKMLVGVRNGHINYYDSIEAGAGFNSKFRLVEKSYQNLWDGYHSSISGGDLNHDNSLDFVLGNMSGGVVLFTSEDSIYIPGIERFDPQKISLLLYPNPTGGDLIVEVSNAGNASVHYSIYNMLGHVLLRAEGVGKMIIDTEELPEGMYILRAENKNRSINLTERFVKSR